MKEEPKYSRGHKMYLDKAQTIESKANDFFACRDGVIESVEYVDCGGYNPYGWTRLMVCYDTKHEYNALICQTKDMDGNIREEYMSFDSDSWDFLKAIINREKELLGGKFELLRDY